MSQPNEAPKNDDRLPPPGSWADVARIMASGPTDPDEPPVDWDAWKDEMKDRED
jgi:hypothetical protein